MLLPVAHRQQRNFADCLAACTAMLLVYYRLPVDYARLIALLDIGPYGAPRRNIMRLSQFGVAVDYREATLPLLLDTLQTGVPVIVFVDTGELSYWDTASNHAVVVVGIEAEHLLVNDPAFEQAPQRIHVDEFELAWLNADYMCATFSRA